MLLYVFLFYFCMFFYDFFMLFSMLFVCLFYAVVCFLYVFCIFFYMFFWSFWKNPWFFLVSSRCIFGIFGNSQGFGQFLYYELLWQPHTDMVNSTPSIMATIYKKGKRVCQHLFQQLGGIQIRHWEHLLFFMSRPACGRFILLQLFPTLPSGRDVKT